MNFLFSTVKNITSVQEQPLPGSRMLAASAGEFWAAAGSAIASFMFLWALIQQYCPLGVRQFLEKYSHGLMNYFNTYIQVSIHEFSGDRLRRSEAFSAVESYLSKNSSKSAKRLRAETGKDSSNLVLSMDDHERVADDFRGVKVWWVLNRTGSPTRANALFPDPDRRFYKLTFHKRYRDLVTESYLKHVLSEGKEIKVKNRQRKLFTNGSGGGWSSLFHTSWSHIAFEHPATFDTIAMEAEKRQEIIDDLLTFTNSKDFYARIGKAWKRGYLLYGPPGTGKSTMIAAMANLLNYDIYDLELTAVKDNTQLRRLLIETTSKSIIVIEDIDCSLDLTGQRKKKKRETKAEDGEKEEPSKKEDEDASSRVTLSGLLNFIDGIWSACGGERLIVFTTNYVEKLDPALIRTGRMDKHIELSYCSFEAFKVLARNYLKLESHQLFEQIKELIGDAKITPADVAENLMPKSPKDDPEKCLQRLIQTLEEVRRAVIVMETQEVNPVGSTISS